MTRIGLLAAAVGALMTAPAMAQTIQQPVVQRDTVPAQLTQQQIRTMQRTLNEKGFSAGEVDGLWGENTAAALKRFQAKNELNPTGELDRTTGLKLGLIEPSQSVAVPAPAPATRPSTASSVPSPSTTPIPTTPPPAVVLAPVPVPAAPVVATTNPTPPVPTPARKQPQPTSGANSFTQAQAAARIQGEGFQNVSDLALDASGVWRGMATKNGQTVAVWLDYQGDVGQ